MARSSGVPQRLRGYDSWIDIPSQPASQSHSPVNSEIDTTGLRIQQVSNSQKRRTTFDSFPSHIENQCTSSQEEYEESESDDDHILTSSNEHFETKPLIDLSSHDVDSDSDRYENSKRFPRAATNARISPDPQYHALKIPVDECCDDTHSFLSPSSTNINPSHLNRNFFHQHSHRRPADHDAALRASLSTLLSIGAAAARGMPNREANMRRNVARNQDLNEPIGLRFVSESELMSPSQQQQISPPVIKATNESHHHGVFLEKNRRKAGLTEKNMRKSQPVLQESIFSSTFLTWAVSAGVLVIISVVGFGVGYVIGKEVGRQEALSGLNSSVLNNSSAGGRETMRSGSNGLYRFKWNTGGVSRNVIT